MGQVDLKSFLEASVTDRVALSFRQLELLSGRPLPARLEKAEGWTAPAKGADDLLAVVAQAGFIAAEVDTYERMVVMQRSANLTDENLEAASDTPVQDETGRRRRRHPAFGALKGLISVEPGYDLTQPLIDPAWLDEKYGA